jgi:gas vesicle protein
MTKKEKIETNRQLNINFCIGLIMGAFVGAALLLLIIACSRSTESNEFTLREQAQFIQDCKARADSKYYVKSEAYISPTSHKMTCTITDSINQEIEITQSRY